MTIHFKDGDALRGFTHVYFKDGANLRQATQVYFKDGDNLRKVYDVSAPGAVPFTINTIGLRVTVSWTPAPDNGFPITMYGLRYRDTDDAAWTEMSLASTVREWTTPTLTLNEEYEFQMRAQNELGWNTWSTSKTATITQNVPSTPGAPILRRRQSGEINAAWTAPNANGAAITAYQLQYKLSTAAGWTTASSTITGTNYTVSGLTNGLTYNFRVRARNVGGWSQYSDTSSLSPANPATAPSAPTWGNFTTATRSITVRWTAPSSNGGSAITGYEIEYRSGTSGSWTDGPDPGANATSRTISGLTPNTSYQFRIRAINRIGNGTWSSNKSGRTRQISLPAAVRITSNQTWTIPNTWGDATSIKFDIVSGSGGSGGGAGGGGGGGRISLRAAHGGSGGAGNGNVGSRSTTASGGGGGGGGPNGGGGGGGSGLFVTSRGGTNGAGGKGTGTGEDGVSPFNTNAKGGNAGGRSGGGGGGGPRGIGGNGGNGGGDGGNDSTSASNTGAGGGGGGGPLGGNGGSGSSRASGRGFGGGGGGGAQGNDGGNTIVVIRDTNYISAGGTGGAGGGGGAGQDASAGANGSNGGDGAGGSGGSGGAAGTGGNVGGAGGSGGSGGAGRLNTQTLTNLALGTSIAITIGAGGTGGAGGGGGGGGGPNGGNGSNGSSGNAGSSGYVLITPLAN